MSVILYDDGADNLDIEEIAEHLRQQLGKVTVEVRGSPFINLPQDKISDFARQLASIKVQELNQEANTEQEALYGEIAYETRRIQGQTRATGVIYDAIRLRRVYLEIFAREERLPSSINIIFTNRLFATWDASNRRYHLRTSIYSIPSFISTTGIVEAPAKPREYYLLKQQYLSLGRDLTELKEKFSGRFIDYDDSRLTEVAKGYAMQAVFYSLTGEPFCEDKGCCLFNAHWQEDLIFAQLESDYEFCPQHAEFMENQRQSW